MANTNSDKDIAEVALEKAKDVTVLIVTTILDCLEESFDCMTYVKGKNLKYVALIVFTFIPVTAIFPKFGANVLIPWQDAVIAFFTMFIIYAINNVNKASIEKSAIMMQKSIKKVEESANKVKGAAIDVKNKVNNSVKERRKSNDAR